MIWGGGGGNQEKKNPGGPSPGKNKSQKAFPRKQLILKRHSSGKNKSIFDFFLRDPPPRSLMVDPLGMSKANHYPMRAPHLSGWSCPDKTQYSYQYTESDNCSLQIRSLW